MRIHLAALFLALTRFTLGADATVSADAGLERSFDGTVHPFVETYCVGCHGKETQKADLDLSAFATLAAFKAGYSYWDLVLERLEAGEMPPEKAKKHPTDEQRDEIVTWLREFRKNEAEKNAGDPGPVLARRLSNSEYDYTIHDLTGVDIRPTKEFPVDPTNQAGFANSGESLAMSPALLKKYLGAARTIADHLVLKPEGFAFAPHPVVADTDRDKYAVLRIVDFYKRQPIDYADYFLAAWRYQNRAALGRPQASLAEIAAENKVSAGYLATIWVTLTEANGNVGPIAKLQSLWRELPAAGVADASPDAPRRQAALRDARAGAERMREFVVHLREKIVPEVKNLYAGETGIQNGSQTLVLWKDRQMAANRRRYDPGALQIEGTPAAEGLAARPAVKSAPVGEATVAEVAETKPAAKMRATATAKAAAAPATATQPVTPAVIRTGGKFLAPAVVTTGSSATFQMAAARKRGTDPDLVVPIDPAERARHEAAFAKFAAVFPDAFYITERARVYLDATKEQQNAGRLLSAGLHSMTGYFRDDGPLYDLILDDAGRRELDALWREFDFSASVPQRMHTSFVWFERTDSSYMRDPEFNPYRPEDKSVTSQAKVKQLAELYLAKAVSNGASETVQAAIKEHFEIVAANILRVEQDRLAAEPSHLQALLEFAARAFRRPLAPPEHDKLLEFYRTSRTENGLDHEEAMRDCIASVLMSPYFCYRIDLVEASGAGSQTNTTTRSTQGSAQTVSLGKAGSPAEASAKVGVLPLSDYALASRLSYFLWSTMPDAALLARAAAGDLHRPEVLAAEARRMLKDGHIRNFATEFAGNWLDFRRFEEHNAVDRERFPTFDNELRTAMFEEPLRFFADIVHEDRSVLNFLYADYTFVNAPLAKHYGMTGIAPPPGEWVRVDQTGQYERGGLLPMAVFLTANSPGLRTSPVKRGYWVVRRVLGERIPPPPAVVPDIPNDEKNLGDLTLRETLAKHRADKTCASCHARFDSFGLVFEGFGPVGERREKDFGGHPVDTRAAFPGGTEGDGLAGLRDYVRAHREGDFVDNLCRKLVAYALGRTLLPSDDALIKDLRAKLAANDHRSGTLVESIVTSPQFRTKRAPAIEPTKTAFNDLSLRGGP